MILISISREDSGIKFKHFNSDREDNFEFTISEAGIENTGDELSNTVASLKAKSILQSISISPEKRNEMSAINTVSLEPSIFSNIEVAYGKIILLNSNQKVRTPEIKFFASLGSDNIKCFQVDISGNSSELGFIYISSNGIKDRVESHWLDDTTDDSKKLLIILETLFEDRLNLS